MTALAGIWRFGGTADLVAECRAMLQAQQCYGRTGPSIRADDGVALGCSLFELLPEDRFDTQPYLNSSARRILAADARVDNRDELLEFLSLRRGTEISDAGLIFRAFDAMGDRLFEKVIGDFALAVWDGREQSLTLVRDHAGQRPLHYHIGNGFVAFASMPEGLHALPEVRRAPNLRQLALFVADVPRRGSESFFEDVARVEPAQILRITRAGINARSYWDMPDRELRLPNQNDYIEAYREQLQRATKARLRGIGSSVAAHLSGGFDSSAIAATAAKVEPARPIVAVTSAPRADFRGPAPSGRITDESGLAARTAALYPNMEHLVLRSAGISPLHSIEADATLYQEPIGHPCNHTWWSRSNEALSERGINVLLTGEAGNLTISAGGLAVLADFIGSGRWGSWWSEARAIVGAVNGPRWRGVLAASFTPWLPRPAWLLFNRLVSGKRGAAGGLSLLHEEWRTEIESLAATRTRGGRPERENKRLRWRILQTSDSGNFRKGALGRWGVDERDPTSDRRLAEFCFSLPPDQLISGGVNRRLARLALADRLPEAVLEGPRGYQFADWYETIDRESLDRQIGRLEQKLAGGSVIDFRRLRSLAASWPQGNWGSAAVIGTYRIMLLRALAAASFESEHCQ
jgi:asparagine synthase (glutamine-hydrolysing)